MCDSRIRRARPEESEVITRLALRSKRHWGYPEELIALWTEDLTITSDYIAKNAVFVAEVDGEIQGVFAVVPVGDSAELEHLWIDPVRIGKGLGKQLMTYAADVARSGGARSMTIVSDPHAEGFYLALGATRVGEAELVPAGRKLPKLTLDLGEG